MTKTQLLTSAQMRAIEAAAIASGSVTGVQLMERAGRGVVQAIDDAFPALATGAHRAMVLCGPGNNGGDGYVIARLLQGRGWQVQVCAYGDLAWMPPDARVNRDLWAALGPIGALDDPHASLMGARAEDAPDLIVDAVFGTGLTRPLPQGVEQPLSELHEARFTRRRFPPIVAVDVPSGLCADSGVAMGDYAPNPLRYDLTVTFHRPRPGHFLADGPGQCGTLRVVDIGLSDSDTPPDAACLTTPGYRLPKEQGHKFSHGHALVLSGGVGRGGAARLAARGALRIGAGLVTLAVPPAALMEHAAQVNAILLARVKDADALAQVLADMRINALCIGPGLGVACAAALLGVALARGTPMVLDADALTALAQAPELLGALHKGCVLTPHGGEFARLFPDIAARLTASPTTGPAYSKVDATRAAAARAGCVVLFKGADTVIADPSGRCAINAAAYDRATPWLATAGAGDVLAGFSAGLLARGYAPFDAACVAAWLHVDCARQFGPGLIAEDLPETLPAVLRALGV